MRRRELHFPHCFKAGKVIAGVKHWVSAIIKVDGLYNCPNNSINNLKLGLNSSEASEIKIKKLGNEDLI